MGLIRVCQGRSPGRAGGPDSRDAGAAVAAENQVCLLADVPVRGAVALPADLCVCVCARVLCDCLCVCVEGRFA